ncbi:hypothetical protein KDAU_48730 [Dictyobacter aurantiacus]|uniref:Uncharacterized protein n=2 Tax=Dictyobacter aurantiacus TaxID=1936993 RepID=A0A401ZL54_9CHLR|nr:hypothetical protein KDAU_48730 [Dictyobacter aurantiacus]
MNYLILYMLLFCMCLLVSMMVLLRMFSHRYTLQDQYIRYKSRLDYLNKLSIVVLIITGVTFLMMYLILKQQLFAHIRLF